MDEETLGRLSLIPSLKMQTTSISVPRPVKGCLAFCTKRNKEKKRRTETHQHLSEHGEAIEMSKRRQAERGSGYKRRKSDRGNGQA